MAESGKKYDDAEDALNKTIGPLKLMKLLGMDISLIHWLKTQVGKIEVDIESTPGDDDDDPDTESNSDPSFEIKIRIGPFRFEYDDDHIVRFSWNTETIAEDLIDMDELDPRENWNTRLDRCFLSDALFRGMSFEQEWKGALWQNSRQQAEYTFAFDAYERAAYRDYVCTAKDSRVKTVVTADLWAKWTGLDLNLHYMLILLCVSMFVQHNELTGPSKSDVWPFELLDEFDTPLKAV